MTAEGVEKSYRRGMWPRRRRQRVLRGADLTLKPAEVVGLVGENGSGKSTLMKILVGALAADEGTITREGRLGYCPQEPQVYGRLTCDEHFELFGHAYRTPPHPCVFSLGTYPSGVIVERPEPGGLRSRHAAVEASHD